jgi:hypothetical protein
MGEKPGYTNFFQNEESRENDLPFPFDPNHHPNSNRRKRKLRSRRENSRNSKTSVDKKARVLVFTSSGHFT